MPSWPNLKLTSLAAHPFPQLLYGQNHVLSEIGAGVFPLGLSELPADIRELLSLRTLTETEAEQRNAHFLFSHERLVEIIRRLYGSQKCAFKHNQRAARAITGSTTRQPKRTPQAMATIVMV